MILFLQSVFLQVNPFDPLITWWRNIWNPSMQGSQTVVTTPDYIPVVIIFIIMMFFFIGVRYVINSRRLPNSEEPLGVTQFVVLKQGIFEAYVNKYEAPFRPSIIRSLRKNKKFAKAIDEILKLREEGHLHFYQLYYRDVRDLLTSTVRGRGLPPMIVSTAPLDDSLISFTQTEAKFSWASLGWDHMKTVVCHEATELIQVEVENDQEMDVWLMAPMPMIKERSKYEHNKEIERIESHYKTWGDDLKIREKPIEITILPYKDEIAQVVASMVMASKQVDYIESLEEHMKSQQHELQERDRVINRLRQTLNLLKLLVGQKKLIGTDLPKGLGRPKDFITWIVLGAGASIFMGLLPSAIPQLQGVDRTLLEVIGLIAVIATYMLTRKSPSQVQQELLEEEEIDMESARS